MASTSPSTGSDEAGVSKQPHRPRLIPWPRLRPRSRCCARRWCSIVATEGTLRRSGRGGRPRPPHDPSRRAARATRRPHGRTRASAAVRDRGPVLFARASPPASTSKVVQERRGWSSTAFMLDTAPTCSPACRLRLRRASHVDCSGTRPQTERDRSAHRARAERRRIASVSDLSPNGPWSAASAFPSEPALTGGNTLWAKEDLNLRPHPYQGHRHILHPCVLCTENCP
jgi:hypothetical protein